MSVQAMSWVLDFSEATNGSRLVLFSIANHCDKFGTDAWPKLETLAQEARLSVREVAYAIKTLTEIGELTVEKGAGKIGRNLYSLTKMLPAKFAGKDDHLPAMVAGSTCKMPQRNKEEPSVPSLNLSPPSSERLKKSDPRYPVFIEALNQGYKRRGWQFGFEGRDGKQLKALLKARPTWKVEDFRRALKFYFESEGIVPGEMPHRYLSTLPRYWSGPLDRFSKLKTKSNEVATVDKVNAVYAD